MTPETDTDDNGEKADSVPQTAASGEAETGADTKTEDSEAGKQGGGTSERKDASSGTSNGTEADAPSGLGKPQIRRIIRRDSFTQTYIFQTSDGKEISRQILSDDEKLTKPSIPETKDGEAFDGWFREDGTEFPDSDFAKTARELNDGEPLSEQTTDHAIVLTAQYRSSYAVRYMSSSREDASVAFTQNYAAGDTIKYPDLREVVKPLDEKKTLIGWSESKDASEPEPAAVVNDDMTLYPVFASAHWIDFQPNGGTPVDPIYVKYDAVTAAPDPEPTKPGYSLEGWYKNKECTQKFTFGEKLNSDIWLYAKWIPAETSHYRIIYWLENGSDRYDTPDEEKTYSYWSSQTVENVETDSLIKATDEQKNYPLSRSYYTFINCTFNSKKSDTDKKVVLADGSTELNLYYDRNVITFNFYQTLKDIGSGAEPLVSIKGLYGQNLDFYNYTLPSLEETQYWLDTIKGWEWHESWLSFYDPSYSGQTVDNFYVIDGTYCYTYYNYYENLDGTWPDKPDPENGTIAYSSGHTWIASKGSGAAFYLEQIRVDTKVDGKWQEGPWKNVYKNDGTIDDSVVDISNDGNRDIAVVGNGKLVHHRLKRSVHRFILCSAATDYSQAEVILSFSDIRYGTPIKDLGKYYDIDENNLQETIKNPPRPENLPDYYVFDGWYTSASSKTHFNFDTAAMGNSDRIAYARWKAPDVRVVVKENNGEDDIILTTHAGESVTEPPAPTREGFAFIGWTDRFGRPIDFAEPVTHNVVVYAAWVSTVCTYKVTYDLNGGSGQVPVDNEKYYEGARAKAASAAGLNPPQGKKGFIAWKDYYGEAYYFPQETVPIQDKDLVLKAVWADGRITKITYDYGYDGRDGGRTESEVITDPNADYTVTRNPERAGYRFLRWETGDGLQIKPGDRIHIDTIDPASNVLYAVWEKLPETKTVQDRTDSVSVSTEITKTEQKEEEGTAEAAAPEKETQQQTVQQQSGGAPATGDTSGIEAGISALILAAAGIVLLLLVRRKKQYF